MVDNTVQSRSLDPQRFTSQWWLDGHSDHSSGDFNVVDLAVGSQVTSSYRTKRGMNKTADDTDFVQTSGSQGGFMKELKDQARVHSTPFDNGHEFSTENWRTTYPPASTVEAVLSGYGRFRYQGYLYPTVSSMTYPDLSFPSASSINADGAELIRRTIPTKPEADMLQFFGELRERLPSLPASSLRSLSRIAFLESRPLKESAKGSIRATRKSARAASDEHLNAQFGIKPLIRDIERAANAVREFHTIVGNYAERSGKSNRKHATLRDETSISSLVGQPGGLASFPWYSAITVNDLVVTPGVTWVQDQTYSKCTFAGAFTYHLAEGHSFLGKMERYGQQADHLLGTRLSASTVWELTPWSWLMDWQADVGGFLSNVERLSSDSLVMRYGYVMHHLSATRTWSHPGIRSTTGSAPGSVQVVTSHERKTRTRATPYGFGLSVGDFSPRQLSILGALGLTRSL